MRACAALIAVMLAAGSALAAPCAWGETDVPALRHYDRLVVLERPYVCPGDATGSMKVRLFKGRGRRGIEIASDTSKIEPRGKWPRAKRLIKKSFPNHHCDDEMPKGAQLRIEMVEGAQRTVYDVTVRAQIEGQGDMAPLSWKGEIAVACLACTGRRGGSVRIGPKRYQRGKLDERNFIDAKASAGWFDCASPGATLALRFFRSKGRGGTGIAPFYEMRGLEKRFARSEDGYTFTTPLPAARLCGPLGAGTHQVEWELMGKGELMRMAGRGRTRLNLVCR